MIEICAELKRLSQLMLWWGICALNWIFGAWHVRRKVVFMSITIARNWLLHSGPSTQLLVLHSKKKRIWGFVKIATLPQSSFQKYLGERSWWGMSISFVTFEDGVCSCMDHWWCQLVAALYAWWFVVNLNALSSVNLLVGHLSTLFRFNHMEALLVLMKTYMF
jgi:hypothetical protein